MLNVWGLFQSQEFNILLKVVHKHFCSDMYPSRMLSAVFSFLWLFMISVAPLRKREWNEQSQQGLWELEKISARTSDQTVALGWILSALYEWESAGKSYFFDRLAAPSLRLTIWVAAQPSPIRLSSFPILLSMRWHFYPPIKTFKGPLSKRKECCFNSVVAPCLGPFFSVCNQPTLASRLMLSSQRQAKRGPSPLRDVWQRLSPRPWALFSLPQALRTDYKPLACLPLLQPHCFSLSTTWLSGLRELAVLRWRTPGLFGSFVRGSQEAAS